MRLITSRLYALLANPAVWSRNGTPLLNGFALLIFAIVLVTLIIKATPALIASSPGLILYKPIRWIWRKGFA